MFHKLPKMLLAIQKRIQGHSCRLQIAVNSCSFTGSLEIGFTLGRRATWQVFTQKCPGKRGRADEAEMLRARTCRGAAVWEQERSAARRAEQSRSMWKRVLSSCASASAQTPVPAPPSPRGLPLVGSLLDLLAAGSTPMLHRYVDARHRELGPVFLDHIGPLAAVFVADANEMRRVFGLEGRYPKHLLPEPWILYNQTYGCKRGLFFMDGAEWHHFRRVMNQLMVKSDMLDILEPCNVVARQLVDSLEPDCEVTNLEDRLYLWSVNVILSVLMGDTWEENCMRLQDRTVNLAAVVHRVFKESARLQLLPAKLAKLLRLGAWKDFVKSVDSALLGANEIVQDIVPVCESGNGLLGRMLSAGVEMKDVQRIVADLILAAGDTTAYATQWCLYLLATHPEIQDKILEDLKCVTLPKDITQLPILKGVLKEALRLYPVAPFLTRYLPEDSIIGGYMVPANHLLFLSLYTSGRNPDYYPDPNRFWPERWTRTSGGSYVGVNNNYASIPFAMGARSCIGKKISETQISLTLAMIIKKFRMLSSEQVEMILQLVSVPSKPVRLKFTRR